VTTETFERHAAAHARACAQAAYVEFMALQNDVDEETIVLQDTTDRLQFAQVGALVAIAISITN